MWYQPTGDHISYPTGSPDDTRLRLCNSLPPPPPPPPPPWNDRVLRNHYSMYHSEAWSRAANAGITIPVPTLIAKFLGPTWGPSGADRTQVGPMLAPWTLLSGLSSVSGIILGLHPVNERRRYFVTTSLIGWGQAENQPCISGLCNPSEDWSPVLSTGIQSSNE